MGLHKYARFAAREAWRATNISLSAHWFPGRQTFSVPSNDGPRLRLDCVLAKHRRRQKLTDQIVPVSLHDTLP